MFEESFRHARTVTTLLLLGSLTSCALPPREAWRIIQTRGLVAYINGDYGPTAPQTRYVAYGAPLQTSTYQQSQVMPLGYRSRDYHGARYLPQYQQRRVQPPPVLMPPPRTIIPYPPPQQLVPAPAPLAVAPQMAPPQPRILTPAPPVRRSTPPPPPVKRESPPAKPRTDNIAGKTLPLTPPASTAIDNLPYGAAIPGRPGMVNSPFAQKQQLVDVTGMSVGQAVKCPYTGKLFRVPPTQQAGATPQSTEPRTKSDSGTKSSPSR